MFCRLLFYVRIKSYESIFNSIKSQGKIPGPIYLLLTEDGCPGVRSRPQDGLHPMSKSHIQSPHPASGQHTRLISGRQPSQIGLKTPRGELPLLPVFKISYPLIPGLLSFEFYVNISEAKGYITPN